MAALRKSPVERLRWRILISILLGLVAGGLTNHAFAVRSEREPRVQGGDFTYPWRAARLVAAGENPYRAIRTAEMPLTPVLYYPLPAAIIAMPFALFPARMAAAAFVGFGVGLLAFVLAASDAWRLLLLVSGPAVAAVTTGQWSPLLTATAALPPLLGLLVAKPNLALPILAYQSSRRALVFAVAGGAVLLFVSFVVQPDWVQWWLKEFRAFPDSQQYRIPILHLVGAPLALSALRWRRADARLLLGMACVPQNMFLYDQLPILLLAKTRAEVMIATIISLVAWYLESQLPPLPSGVRDLGAQSLVCLPYVVLGVYLPALIIVLRRPNECDSTPV
jgi:hypothetical protein